MELLVAMSILALLIALISQLLGNALKITDTAGKRMDADSQARTVFDRMALDFTQMVQRKDMDCFLKDSANPQNGNDQLAFFSHVPGYPSPDSDLLSPFSLVGYRINTNGKLQRLGYGLLWNGVSTDQNPQNMPLVFQPLKISDTWSSAVTMDTDDNYELAGSQVFRMEYYYVLKGTICNASILSSIPWDKRPPTSHAAADGLRDVAAIGVVIAVIDPKSQNLVSSGQLKSLADQLCDFPQTDGAGNNASKPGELEAQWQKAINRSGLPPAVVSSIRVYRRWFSLTPGSSPNP